MKTAVVFIFIILVIVTLFGVYFYTRGEAAFKFEKTIHTLEPHDKVWSALEGALRDSQGSSVWPNDYSVIKSDGLRDGAELEITYFMPFATKTFTYVVSDYIEGETFSYNISSSDTFKGGETVSLREWDGGTEIVWKGSYRYKGFSLTAMYFRLYFNQGFFGQLEENIRGL